ncbi:MAG: DUF5312 domain-containing protein [Spirochaetaceae bacterium]|jgi:hypothetical protein|nr:DUF5312 domain-containing protein [Spirochaetaceae bacterium]
MDETAHFNQLVADLSLEERASLLEKLSSQSTFSDTVLYEEAEDEEAVDLELRYKTLPWYYKIWYKFLSFFNSRSPLKLFEDHLMIRIYRNMDEASPGFYNYQKDILLPKFHDELVKLRDGSRFFYTALDQSLNRDKGSLVVFLGSLEMPQIHRLIQTDTEPALLAAHYRDLGDSELRQKALKALDDALMGITEDQRNIMYHSARLLYCLKQLSSFLFDRLINLFVFDSSVQGNICPAAPVREQLLTLNNILASLKVPPSMSLLESLFIFVLMEKSGEPGFDIQMEMRKLLARAELSLQGIREFNLEVPMTKLLRCISRNMTIVPQSIGGGEDWYAVYRERWKNIIEEQFANFIKTRRQNDLQNSFRYFFMGNHLKMLENMYSETNPAGMNVKGNFSLSFLQTFYSVVFMAEINKFIRPILIDGEFYKKENRTEFTESYNTLIKMEDIIFHYDRDISAAGEYGKRYAQAKNDMSSLPIKRRKIQIVMEEAAEDAERIIGEAREAMTRMINVLGGILKKSPDGKYDSLSNLSALSGRGTAFADGIVKSISQFRKALQLLDEIDSMETGR